MCHCQICNFCETTSNSDFQTEETRMSNNKVKWYEELGGFYCLECKEGIRMAEEIYQDDRVAEQEEYDWRDFTERREPVKTTSKQNRRKSPALSEV